MKTLAEWQEHYRKKTGRSVAPKPYKRLKFDPNEGFMYWGVLEDTLVVCETVGNGAFWMHTAKQLAKEYSCSKITTVIYCNPSAYMRLFPGTKIDGTVMVLEV